MIKKIPWSVIAGIAAVAAFYATAAIVILYIVFGGIKGQTNESATLFDSWYQILLFIADIIMFLLIIGASVMAVLVKKGKFDNKNVSIEQAQPAAIAETEDENAQIEEDI